ncbi:HpaII family restriction endonuclease [Frigoriflavimonas asaccharolytica]|uniref:HpaII restriction endonuclease n=1 Tax=Frigoriflavimonas asaccharolytica TaxID=2735899 RepID=A0A8J8G6W0_9FLAO|nr:HpaII family restriction endonuclease [Frigoriflavimonas asaccharolytica]NRS91790.1 hypothetical protein [Frigoriflavimonas asaccharolytica]
MLTGNKGEWSELYALIKLMSDGKLFQSDIDLNIDPQNVYDVIAAYKKDVGYDLKFERNDSIKVYKIEDDVKTLIVEKSFTDFKDMSHLLLEGIKEGAGKTFKLPLLDKYFDELKVAKVQAGAKSKADLKLRIYDHRLAKEADLGFSIKSLLGSQSTLFNPDVEGNFIFEVNEFDVNSISKFNQETYTAPKITNRIRRIEQEGFVTTFAGIQSTQLRLNLKMIDGDMPDIMAWALYFRYRDKKSSLIDITNTLENEDPLNLYQGTDSGQKMYEYKLKKFLMDSAMGMTTKTPWHGEYDSFGGVVIVKKDGDIVCFHVYDLNLFRNYLLKNTFLEQPGTGEDAANPGNANPMSAKKYYYGWLYEENDKCYFKINLQVRFLN